MSLTLSTTMDNLASALTTGNVVATAYGWPAKSIQPPCAIIAYPEITFDENAPSSDVAVFPVWLVIADPVDRMETRDTLSTLITNARTALNGMTSADVRVLSARPDTLTVDGVPYLAAVLETEVYA